MEPIKSSPDTDRPEAPRVRPAPPFYDDLDASLLEAWRLLRRGVKDRRSPFHTPALATRRDDGFPAVRTVVLRAVDVMQHRLRFHTDARSAKFREISADPRVAVHFYDPSKKVQLRADGRATLHRDDELADTAWRATRLFSRACYRVAEMPGTVVANPQASSSAGDADDPDAGRENFAAISVSIDGLEWLYLAARGHRRARFSWTDGEVEGAWLIP
ncbi:MAG: pyridoxamine 5'-phosphate oxidase family protein [Kiloniellales bacterium]|nr:pyridoxamine 5'-phosphate oxidase family protein [Kiloniellales bacterium]